METMKTIANRQSCRAYTGEQITEAELQTILQAGNAAPVAFGKYSNIMITVVQRQNILEKIDAIGAKFYGMPNMQIRFGAPTLIIVSAKINGDMPDFLKPMTQNDNGWANCDTACVMENMALAATDLGLGNVYLYGVAVAIAQDIELCAELKIPKDFKPLSALPVGKASKPLKERELAMDKVVIEYIR